jgi:hypothetical protein
MAAKQSQLGLSIVDSRKNNGKKVDGQTDSESQY